MYKENIRLSFPNDKLWVQEFGEEITLNAETVGKSCNMGRYYFHCNECDNQSIADDEGTCFSCNNYSQVWNDTETKHYCKNYKKGERYEVGG